MFPVPSKQRTRRETFGFLGSSLLEEDFFAEDLGLSFAAAAAGALVLPFAAGCSVAMVRSMS